MISAIIKWLLPEYKTIMAEGGEDPQENPFSFKKFVKTKTSPSDENQPNHRPGGGDDDFCDSESGAAAEAGGKGAKQAEGLCAKK